MKIKTLIIILLVITLTIITYNKVIKTKELNEFKSNKIDVLYPNTEYKNLNDLINTYINSKITEFNLNVDIKEFNYPYYLIIKYNEYQYKDILSYVFFLETFVGGAHPYYEINTINYDKNTMKIIKIDDLINKHPAILNTFSKESYNKFNKLKVFKEKSINNMLKSGTLPNKDNFKKFVFTKNGILIYFDRYTIAPYYFGDYNILVSYKKIRE